MSYNNRVTYTLDFDPVFKKLTVRGAEAFPAEIFDYAESLEILDMSHGRMSALPDDLGRLKKLKVAFFSHNDFEEVPEVLAECTGLAMVGFKSCRIERVPEGAMPAALRGLILTDNKIRELPASIGGLEHLQKLMLAGNQLESLPRELAGCRNLELMRVSANRLAEAPAWLLDLPLLAWYSDAGNAFSVGREPEALAETRWADIILGSKLGESAKNVVYQAMLRKTGQEVAVKLYGGAVTTDGYPQDEMRVHVAAGRHVNLIGVIGRLAEVPDGREGLVMELVPPAFSDVGLPPDFETLTRDVYAVGRMFSTAFVTRVLTGVAGVMEHLHARGIMHGDLYAHNILANAAGECFVGDFGAASFYAPSAGFGHERAEVLAYGRLMDELLSRCEEGDGRLSGLRERCLSEDAAGRPLFREICEFLGK